MATLSPSARQFLRVSPRLPALRGAMTVACPICDARPRQKCWSMPTGPRRDEAHQVTAATTKHRYEPHQARVDAAKEVA